MFFSVGAMQGETEAHNRLFAEAFALARSVAQVFIESNRTLAVAESCTGGLISNLITDVPGSSRFFVGGLCTYSVKAKTVVLGVEADLIEQYGVVSAEVAVQMASGVRRILGSDVGLATTGLAGPATGEEKLPVGTVFIGIASGKATKSVHFQFEGSRVLVKLLAARAALELILRCC